VPLANDTSFGVGFAPATALERFVLELDREIGSAEFVREHPAHGEDVKIMAARNGSRLSLTIARAFVAAHVPSLELSHARSPHLGSRQVAGAISRPAPGPSVSPVGALSIHVHERFAGQQSQVCSKARY
jgi:hypothetical protein